MTPYRAGGRCDLPTPKQSPVSRPYSLTEEMPSSVESGARPSIRGSAFGTKRRVGFDIEGVGTDASGSKSKRGDDPMIGYEAMQTRIANRKKELEKCAAGTKPVKGSNKKRVKKTKEARDSEQDANETRARELTCLLAQALKSIQHHEETDYPKQSDCAALLPLAMKVAKVYQPCSKLVKRTELMEAFGDTYSENYDIRPRRRESLVDWLTKLKVLYRLEWCDMAFQKVDGVMAILETCE